MCIKSDFKEIYLKLATNEQSEKAFFFSHQNFISKGLSNTALELYTCIKSDFKDILLNLATNGQSDKAFVLTSDFVPKGLSCPCSGAIYIYIKYKKKL